MANNNQNQGQQKQDKRPIIELLTDEPVKGSNGWELMVCAVFGRGNTPANGEAICFYSNLEFVTSADTNADGRTDPIPMTIPESATLFNIEAHVESQPNIRDRKRIPVPKQASPQFTAQTKTADKLKLHAHGNDGKYQVTASVTAQDRTPLKGVLIIAFDTDKEDMLVEGRTDDNGRATLKIPHFIEPGARDVRFMAPATAMPIKKLRLYGPPGPRHQKERPILDPAKMKMDWNPLNTIRLIISAWKQGGERNQQNRTD